MSDAKRVKVSLYLNVKPGVIRSAKLSKKTHRTISTAGCISHTPDMLLQ